MDASFFEGKMISYDARKILTSKASRNVTIESFEQTFHSCQAKRHNNLEAVSSTIRLFSSVMIGIP